MVKLLADVCKIQYGFPFNSAEFNDTKGMPLVRIRDVVRGYSETYTNEPCSDEYIVNNGDILIGMDGEFNIARWKGGKAYLNQRVCRLIPNKEIDSDFLFHYMPNILKKIEEETPFVTVKHLSAKQLNQVMLHLPNTETQKHIAAVLNMNDNLIVIRKQQLAKLDELVKARFVEMFGEPSINPLGWPIRKFKDISIIITDGEHITPSRKKNGIYLLSARNILNHMLKLDDVDYIDDDEYSRISRRIIPQKGDVLISCSGSIGRCCVVPDRLKFQMVRSVALIRFDSSVNPFFAEWLIASDELQRQIAYSATRSSQANLFQGKIKELQGYVPPKDLQDLFAGFVRQVNGSKDKILKALTQLETLKKSLMQKYFG